jgi:hypothetical protein
MTVDRDPAQGRPRALRAAPVRDIGVRMCQLRQTEDIPRRGHRACIPDLWPEETHTLSPFFFFVLQARFRVYGAVAPVYPKSLSALFDLAHVFAGGRVERVSDQHYGVGENLLLPGRGERPLLKLLT